MKILIADDDAALRMALVAILQKWGHEIVEAEDGAHAWEILQTHSPDLAILDWMMPCISGIDLCRRIRERGAQVFYVYVIMLTSKTECNDIVAGMDAGADDYLTKPFNKKILRSRLAVGARIIHYETLMFEKTAQLQRNASEMEELAQERSKQLVHAERMATIGLLSAGIAHEINNSTAFIAGNIQTLERFCGEIEATLRERISTSGENAEKFQFILEEMPKTIKGARHGVTRISRIVKELKNFCRKNEGSASTAACDLNACVEQAIELCWNTLKYHVAVERDLADNLRPIKADPQQIEQVLINLFVNAADAMRENGLGTLAIRTRNAGNDVAITVSDTGPGIPDDKLDAIWQPFYTTKPPGKGTGLGLFTVRGIIENQGGQIKVRNKASSGAEFTITLPAVP